MDFPANEGMNKEYEFPINDYPVSLALWHWNMNGVATAISGDK